MPMERGRKRFFARSCCVNSADSLLAGLGGTGGPCLAFFGIVLPLRVCVILIDGSATLMCEIPTQHRTSLLVRLLPWLICGFMQFAHIVARNWLASNLPIR